MIDIIYPFCLERCPAGRRITISSVRAEVSP
jgi:hypothetical protein